MGLEDSQKAVEAFRKGLHWSNEVFDEKHDCHWYSWSASPYYIRNGSMAKRRVVNGKCLKYLSIHTRESKSGPICPI